MAFDDDHFAPRASGVGQLDAVAALERLKPAVIDLDGGADIRDDFRQCGRG
jgi:hypothetical protein